MFMQNHNWKKLGQLFQVNNQNPYLCSHAANPLAVHLENDIFRIFYSGRNKENKSSIGYVDINIITQEIINYPKEPILVYGNENSFYSHGISIGNAFDVNDKTYILFMGWQYPKNEHWRGDVGRIELTDKIDMKVTPSSAFMGIDEEDKISLSYPFVMYHEGIYKMWYGSTITWDAGNNEMIHAIKYATSKDGENWQKHGVAIPYEIGIAQAFSKPSVIIENGIYHMWFSFREGTGKTYRIGYATSKNGIEWKRHDNYTGIDVSEEGWDSQMICYSFVFSHKENYYMLYNGNQNGKEGFGLTILKTN